MCDTFVATAGYTANSAVIFGKNSDREPNEAQAIVRIPRKRHETRELQTTYITIPQVPETYEVLLSKPFQMWGAEMGANEHGLVIGNEAVFTRLKFAGKNDGLTGMDMIRLALERTRSADDALGLITELIEQYGQDACGGYTDKGFFYHNSFIIADPDGALILESAGKHWVAVRVNGFRSISNGLTIDGEFDFSSKGVIDFAKQQGWIARGRDFSFREAYSDSFFTYFSKCRVRQSLSTKLGHARTGALDAAGAMTILRSHGDQGEGPRFDPSSANMGSLCLHATGLTTPSQTTGSLVAELHRGRPSSFWLTGTAAPCLSVFRPFFLPGTNLRAGEVTEPGATPDDSLWWKFERLHRRALKNYETVYAAVERDRAALETDFLTQEKIYTSRGASADELSAFSQEAGERANALLDRWLATLDQAPLATRGFAPIYRLYRAKIDRAVGLQY
jgi:dipeptidase